MARVKIRFDQAGPAQRRKAIRQMGQHLDINESLESLIQTMHAYEAQFGMSTVEFYARYLAGKMGDSRDVMRWAGAFDDYQALLREHFRHAAA
ncbi:MAG TPA: hypothetical protein VNQ79_06315 [Blastocatellia bacterium]|nr:hypothetical protein [Blastocatellia bacterium]